MAAEAHLIQTIIGIGILLFAAKLMAELFLRLKLPIVLGELLAGMIIGPFALGSFIVNPNSGDQLLVINDEIRILGEMGAIVILFMAGLEMTPKEFLRGGKASLRDEATGGEPRAGWRPPNRNLFAAIVRALRSLSREGGGRPTDRRRIPSHAPSRAVISGLYRPTPTIA